VDIPAVKSRNKALTKTYAALGHHGLQQKLRIKSISAVKNNVFGILNFSLLKQNY